jgi:hypothetical protein
MSDETVPNIYEDNEHVTTLAEALGHYYKGQKVQVYWSDAGGSTNYSDYQISNLLYAEGTVLWGRGSVFALECEVETSTKKFKTIAIFNEYNVYVASPIDGVDIMHLFKGFKGRLKGR